MVVSKKYIPDQGDVAWVNFNPQTGREQASKRPALILSPKIYNQKTGLALMCPITSKIKKYPFEVFVSEQKIKGAVLADQVRSLDWNTRKAKFIQKLSKVTLKKVQDKIIFLVK